MRPLFQVFSMPVPNTNVREMQMSKISIRFFDDKEVRAVWDDEKSKWWFSVPDVIGVLRGTDDYGKNRNDRKYLKLKPKKENSGSVSTANQLKPNAADGEKYPLVF